MFSAEELIEMLRLKPLPREGGWYAETYRSDIHLPTQALAPYHVASRDAATAIYYLLTPDTCSALHRLRADEIFHFYLGDPVEMLQLDPTRRAGSLHLLGTDLAAGQRPQVVVRRGIWQGSRLLPGGRFALLGTTMAPGFDFADYEPGSPALAAEFPPWADHIRSLAHPTGP